MSESEKLGDLQVGFKVDTTELLNGFNAAQESVQKNSKQMSDVTSSFSKTFISSMNQVEAALKANTESFKNFSENIRTTTNTASTTVQANTTKIKALLESLKPVLLVVLVP